MRCRLVHPPDLSRDVRERRAARVAARLSAFAPSTQGRSGGQRLARFAPSTQGTVSSLPASPGRRRDGQRLARLPPSTQGGQAVSALPASPGRRRDGQRLARLPPSTQGRSSGQRLARFASRAEPNRTEPSRAQPSRTGTAGTSGHSRWMAERVLPDGFVRIPCRYARIERMFESGKRAAEGG